MIIRSSKENSNQLAIIFDEWTIKYYIVESAKKALLYLRNNDNNYNSFIIDYTDTSFDPIDLFKKIKQIKTNSTIVMITDYNVIEA